MKVAHRPSPFAPRSLLIVISAGVGLCCSFGCRPAMEVSEQAVALPLLDRDPAETSDDAGQWPGWRGPDATGIAPSGSPAIRFSDTEGVRWKTVVPGQGNSSPVVWGDRVLLTSALDDAARTQLAILCFDRGNGRLLWQSRAGPADGRTHVKNGYASASAATDGRRIFVFFGSTGLFCYDFSGKQLWRADLGRLDHQWGTAASPVLYGNTVIQLCDGEQQSYLAAFDQPTGRQVWRAPRASNACWSTPVLVRLRSRAGERTELIVNGTGADRSDDCRVIAYDPADGRELWCVSGTTSLVTPTMLVGGGLVYSTSGRNGPIMAIRPGGSGNVTGSHVVWRASRGGPYIPTGVVYRNRLYLIGDSGWLSCYDAGDGRQIWTARLRGAFSSSLVAADGRIYATSEQGVVYVVAAADSFELLAENPMHARCLATPAVVQGELLIRTEGELYCIAKNKDCKLKIADCKLNISEVVSSIRNLQFTIFNLQFLASAATAAEPQPALAASRDVWPLFRGDPQATGVAKSPLPEKLERLWTFSGKNDGFESTAAIVDGVVYAASTEGRLYALKLTDGTKLWEYGNKLGFSASPAYRNGRIYLGDSDGTFHCVRASDGKLQWKFSTEAEINSSANFYGTNVLFGSQDGKLYCLKADTGEQVWRYESRDQIRCFPTIMGDTGFVAGCDSHLHVIDLKQGKDIASVDLQSPTGCSPAVLGERIFVGTEGNTFFAIDPKQAKILWQYSHAERPGSYRSSAAVTPEAVIVGSRDKLVHALDPKTGKSLWEFATRQRVDGSPVVVGSRVFVGSGDGRLYALDLKTGKELWRFEAGGSIVASPAVAQGRLVIGTDSGDLYCFGAK